MVIHSMELSSVDFWMGFAVTPSQVYDAIPWCFEGMKSMML